MCDAAVPEQSRNGGVIELGIPLHLSICGDLTPPLSCCRCRRQRLPHRFNAVLDEQPSVSWVDPDAPQTARLRRGQGKSGRSLLLTSPSPFPSPEKQNCAPQGVGSRCTWPERCHVLTSCPRGDTSPVVPHWVLPPQAKRPSTRRNPMSRTAGLADRGPARGGRGEDQQGTQVGKRSWKRSTSPSPEAWNWH